MITENCPNENLCDVSTAATTESLYLLNQWQNGALLVFLKGIAESWRENLAPGLFIQQNQIVNVSSSEPAAANFHCHFLPLKYFKCFLGGHCLGGTLITPVASTNVDGAAAKFTHLAFFLGTPHRQVRNVFERYKHTAKTGLAWLHTTAQDFVVFQVGTEASSRHELPSNGLVESIKKGLVFSGSPRWRAWFLHMSFNIWIIRFSLLTMEISIQFCKIQRGKSSAIIRLFKSLWSVKKKVVLGNTL